MYRMHQRTGPSQWASILSSVLLSAWLGSGCDRVDPDDAELRDADLDGACEHGCGGEAAAERIELDLDGAPAIGPADAAVTVVAFSDFECPYCRKGAQTVRELAAAHPDQVRVVFLNLPLPMHGRARPAAIAAMAAHRQGKFWEMHDRMFTNGGLGEDALVEHAAAIGLDVDRFRRDLGDDELAAAVDRDAHQAAELGIRGTPTFFLNGRKLQGAQPLAEFERVLREELEARPRRRVG